MLYAIIGFIALAIMMLLIMRGKVSPAFCFTIIPIVTAVLCGFGYSEIVEFIDKGMSSIWKTALLFVFSVSYFGIMNDAGLFDPMVKALVKIAGHNVVLIMVATSLIAVVGHMDGAAASTYLITIPVMLPIYKKFGISPVKLLLLTGLSTGIMNLVPWGGPTIRAATAISIDPNVLWVNMIPMQIFGLVVAIVSAVLIGLQEKKRIEHNGVVIDLQSKEQQEGEEEKHSKMLPVNLVLTIVVIAFLVKGGIAPFIVFLFGTMIALTINYPDMKQQMNAMVKYAESYSNLVVTIVAAGVFLGVFANSGIITSMAQVLISMLPHELLRYLHIIMGILGAPLGMVMGPDPYYYAVMPLVIETVSQFGVTPEQVAHAMLIGENVGLSVSPCIAVNFLALGLAGVELKDHIRANFKWMWLVSVLMLLFGVLIGLV